MELMYIDKNCQIFKKGKFIAVYKDKLDLVNYGIELLGINFDDEWKVRRFLNGYKLKIDTNIIDIFKDLDLNLKLLDKKIKDLSKSQYKMILLVYSLLQDRNILVLDYFDKGLDSKNKNKIINYLKIKYNKTLVVISNDIVFLNKLCTELIIFENNNIIFNDEFNKIYKSTIKIDMPEIIKFIRLANKKKKKLDYTVDSKELLKDIYRSVK